MTAVQRVLRMLPVLAAIPAAVLLTDAAAAQAAPDAWLAECRADERARRGERHCEIRTFDLAATGELEVTASPNGGIEVTGWDGDGVQVVALLSAESRTRGEAEALARQVQVRAEPGSIRTDGPRPARGSGWSVSYRLRVPNRTDLDLESTNGGIEVSDVEGELRLQTTNGGIALSDVAGDVRGQTVNGGVRVELQGDGWRGPGLDVETTNGGVSLAIPEGYSAELTASTVNGGFDTDFPVTVEGRIGRRLNATLGRGGAPIRIQTTNGGISLRRR